jgi:hypothetical protein
MKKISRIKILPTLPTSDPDAPAENLPKDIVGAKILAIGAPSNYQQVGKARIAIDYLPTGETIVRRIILEQLAFSSSAFLRS